MRIFIEYSQGDYKALQEHAAEQSAGGLASMVLRGINKLGSAQAKKNCPNRCKKIKRQYKVSNEIANNLKIIADNEGLSVAMLIQKRVVHPLIYTSTSTDAAPAQVSCPLDLSLIKEAVYEQRHPKTTLPAHMTDKEKLDWQIKQALSILKPSAQA